MIVINEKNKITLAKPDVFKIRKENILYDGPNQIWYSKKFQRMAGCGPTSCSNIVWYLSQTKEKYKNLCNYDGTTYDGFLKLMEDMWQYVTPGFMGVRNVKIFEKGVVKYGKDKGISLSCQTFKVPEKKYLKETDIEAAFDFIEQALKEDLPVAFLNLSNGHLTNLESWHWVTIVELDRENGSVSVLDQSRIEKINLKLWMSTTNKGGGFVVVR